jgi:hypothetical protein
MLVEKYKVYMDVRDQAVHRSDQISERTYRPLIVRILLNIKIKSRIYNEQSEKDNVLCGT